MNAYTHLQLAKTRQADRLLAAAHARTARAAQSHRRGTGPGHHQGAFAVGRVAVLTWARAA